MIEAASVSQLELHLPPAQPPAPGDAEKSLSLGLNAFSGGKTAIRRASNAPAIGRSGAANAIPAPPPPGPPDLRVAKIAYGGGGESGAGHGVRPLGQWSSRSRWTGGAASAIGRQHRLNGGGDVGRTRLTARLAPFPQQERQATMGLPFGLRRSGGDTSARPPTTADIEASATGAATSEDVDDHRGGVGGRRAANGGGGQTRRSLEAGAGATGVQPILMQLIDVQLELPQLRSPTGGHSQHQHRASASNIGFGGPPPPSRAAATSAADDASSAPLQAAMALPRVHVGDVAALGAEFARQNVGRARRLHPMLDAHKRRSEDLVRATYLTSSSSVTSSRRPRHLSNSLASASGVPPPIADIVGVWGDDPYNSSLRSRVRSAYFAHPLAPTPSPPPLLQLSRRQAEPNSRDGSADILSDVSSCRTLRSPSPRQPPPLQPPNTADSGAGRRGPGRRQKV